LLPKITQFFTTLGELSKGDPDTAIEDLEQAITVDPKNLKLKRDLHFLYTGALSSLMN